MGEVTELKIVAMKPECEYLDYQLDVPLTRIVAEGRAVLHYKMFSEYWSIPITSYTITVKTVIVLLDMIMAVNDGGSANRSLTSLDTRQIDGRTHIYVALNIGPER